MTAARHTLGPWRAVAQGGSSTVLSQTKPPRNDTRIPGYGYRDDAGHCIAYPFLDDERGIARLDFVCFSHADARLIAAAPDLYAACCRIVAAVEDGDEMAAVEMARAALSKANGDQ